MLMARRLLLRRLQQILLSPHQRPARERRRHLSFVATLVDRAHRRVQELRRALDIHRLRRRVRGSEALIEDAAHRGLDELLQPLARGRGHAYAGIATSPRPSTEAVVTKSTKYAGNSSAMTRS